MIQDLIEMPKYELSFLYLSICIFRFGVVAFLWTVLISLVLKYSFIDILHDIFTFFIDIMYIMTSLDDIFDIDFNDSDSFPEHLAYNSTCQPGLKMCANHQQTIASFYFWKQLLSPIILFIILFIEQQYVRPSHLATTLAIISS